MVLRLLACVLPSAPMSSYWNQYSSQVKQKEDLKSRVKFRTAAASGLTLSAVLAQTPAIFDGRRINAVDKNVSEINVLPEKYAMQIKTIYLSKNLLKSLDGIAQFKLLKALSVADNKLLDFDALRPLKNAGLKLEAANFEGNPVTELPNYRAHVFELLGSSLQTLDNLPVSAEEVQSASNAVAQEATIISLMLSNACLVHKLGKAVQMTRLHCELKCAVLTGQCGGGAILHNGQDSASSSKILQLWDYEGSLTQPEKHTIALAIRREVGRKYKRMQLAGAKLDGSAKAWQQAFAQVMLAQQETVASLVRLLENARCEADAVLRPMTRPLSPMKIQAVHMGEEADSKLKNDREALISELRDAYLGLANGQGVGRLDGRSLQHKEHTQGLHCASQRQSCFAAGQETSITNMWTIPAEQKEASFPANDPRSTTIQSLGECCGEATRHVRKVGCARPMSASDGGILSKTKPTAIPRPMSGSAWGGVWNEPVQAGEERVALQGINSLPKPNFEKHRRTAPEPFGQGRDVDDRTAKSACAQRRLTSTSKCGDGAKKSMPLPLCEVKEAMQESERTDDMPLAKDLTSPSLPMIYGSRPESPLQQSSASQDLCTTTSPPVSPSQWTANPLASAHLPQSASSPVFQNLSGILSCESGKKQTELLDATVKNLQQDNGKLHEANTELANSLQQLHLHAQGLESKLVQQDNKYTERIKSLLTEVASVNSAKQLLDAEVASMQSESGCQMQMLEQQSIMLNARMAEVADLRRTVHKLEAQSPISLSFHVDYEEEFLSEKVKSKSLEEQLEGLTNKLQYKMHCEQVQRACQMLCSRSTTRRVFGYWRSAAVDHKLLRRLGDVALVAEKAWLLRKWLHRWRLAVIRSRVLSDLDSKRRLAVIRRGWEAWRSHCGNARLSKTVHLAAELHRQVVISSKFYQVWRDQAAKCRQIELPEEHPVFFKAAKQRQALQLAVAFKAWKCWYTDYVKPKLAQLHMLKAQQLLRAERRAWMAWQSYLTRRHRMRFLTDVANQHFLAKCMQIWKTSAFESKAERALILRGSICHRILSLRRAWKAWWNFVKLQQKEQGAMSIAAQHRTLAVLRSGWLCWQGWVQLTWHLREMQSKNLQRYALHAWKLTAESAHKWRCAVSLYERKLDLRCHQALIAWQQAIVSKRLRAHKLVHVQELLLRKTMNRSLAAWRRTAMMCKLHRALELVQQLQAAVQRVRNDLEAKASQIGELESIKVTVETHAESLSLKVTSLNSELESAKTRVADLHAALQKADAETHQALAAKADALTARDAAIADNLLACKDRDAEAAGRAEALRRADQAVKEAEAAQMLAQSSVAEAQSARHFHIEAERNLNALITDRDSISMKHEQTLQDMSTLELERTGLLKDMQQALTELQRLTDALDDQKQENALLKKQHDEAVADQAAAREERQAAYKQADRLSTLCEEKERDCRTLQRRVDDLQAQLETLQLLDAEVKQVTEHNDRLHDENKEQKSQLQQLSAALDQAKGDQARLQASYDALKAGEVQLLSVLEEQQRQCQELSNMAFAVERDKSNLEARVQSTQAAADKMTSEKQSLTQALNGLKVEQQGLMASGEKLAAEKKALELHVDELKAQLQHSTIAMNSVREMLAGCSTRGRENANAPIMQLLGEVKAALLEKDSRITALAEENRRRGDRIQALQSQVASWENASRRSAMHAGFPVAHQDNTVSAVFRENCVSSNIKGSSSDNAGIEMRCPASKLPTSGEPSAEFSFSHGFPGSPSSRSAAEFAAHHTSSRATRRDPTLSPSPSAEDFLASSSSSMLNDACSCSPATFQSSKGHADRDIPAGWIRNADNSHPSSRLVASPPCANPTAALRSMLGRLAHTTPSAPISRIVPSHCSLNAPSPSSGSLSCSIQQLPAEAVPHKEPQMDPVSGTSVTETGSRKPDAGFCAAADESDGLPMSAEVSQERLSFLLELVVQKPLSAEDAQQVIKSAGEGDARPLLRVLDSVKRKFQGDAASTTSELQEEQPKLRSPLPAGLSPGSANELAAVRRQIQMLQKSIRTNQK